MNKFILVGILILSGCANKFQSLEESHRICNFSYCSETPLLMIVMGHQAPKDTGDDTPILNNSKISGFSFVGWVRYDGSIKTYGPKSLTVKDINGEVICKGHYDWDGFGRVSDVELRCFEDSELAKGKIRNAGRQPEGVYRGKGIGTGVLKFNGGLISFIYGVNPPEIKKYSFKELWQKYGGDVSEVPFRTPNRSKRVPRLKPRVKKEISA